MPAWRTNNTSAEFGAGTSPSPASGHANTATVAPVATYDTSWQDMEREQGGYQPGSYPELEDQLSQGSDDAS